MSCTVAVRHQLVLLHESIRKIRLLIKIYRLRFGGKHALPPQSGTPKLIVSLTSFPPRIPGLWAAIEAVFNQTLLPDKIILALAIEDFPGKRLPRSLVSQVARGLEIFWLEENGRSFDKLLPSLSSFPDSCIVTIDDDKLIPNTLLRALYTAHLENPTAIVGGRGWSMRRYNGQVSYGRGWERAVSDTPSHELFMTGNGGILYPPGSLADGRNTLDQAREVAPSADDIWFWAISVACGTPLSCLGLVAHPVNILQRRTPALSDLNATENNPQFQAVLDFFNLRHQLNASLPEIAPEAPDGATASPA